jgi:uncharacterized delta-60 repeat protein
VSPDGTESCNGIDDNCDGAVDEGTDEECGDGTCTDGECVSDCPAGQLDVDFGVDGFVQLDLGADDYLEGLAIQADDAIVVTGSNGSGQFEVVRFTASGALDTSFGTDGRVSTGYGAPANSNAIAVQDDGQILVVGNTSISCSEEWNRYALARYNPDGSLDPSFGSGGTQTTNWGSVGSSLYSIGLQSDGKIVVAGSRYAGACSPGINLSTVTRYTQYGELDTTFGSGGETRVDIHHGPHHDGNRGVVIRSDDSIVTTSQEHYSSWAGLQHYTADGSHTGETYLSGGYGGGIAVDDEDNVIANTQYVVYGPWGLADDSPAPFVTSANALVLDDTGRPLVLGHSTDAFRVVRYLTDGSLDTSFAGDGVAEIEPGYPTFRARAMALQSDGKIVVGGVVDSGGGDDFVVVRICP